MLRRVVFPEPEGPSSVTHSPLATTRSAPTRASTLPYRFDTPASLSFVWDSSCLCSFPIEPGGALFRQCLHRRAPYHSSSHSLKRFTASSLLSVHQGVFTSSRLPR